MQSLSPPQATSSAATPASSAARSPLLSQWLDPLLIVTVISVFLQRAAERSVTIFGVMNTSSSVFLVVSRRFLNSQPM